MRTAVLLAACLLAASCADACIYKFGSSPDSLAPPVTGTKWTHGFLGDDWNGTDGSGKPWVCLTGKKQSPINIPGPNRFNGARVDYEFQTRFYYPDLVSNGSNLEVINTGHTIQVEWKYNYGAEVSIAVPANATASTPVTAVLGMKAGDAATWAKAVPAQFHFHSHSEHTLDGRQFPLELHIVHSVTDPAVPACAGGCFSVLGIFFEVYDGPDNVLLKTIWDNMPMREGAINMVPAGGQIPLGDMLPSEDLRDYVTYEGSLTTPPCSEGLLWHVLTKPQRISVNQWRKYLSAVGMKDCTQKASSPAASPAATPAAGRRMLLETEAGAEYECKVGAYGYNYRLVQPINGRVVKAARAW